MRLCLVVAALLASAHGWLKVLLCHRFDGLGLVSSFEYRFRDCGSVL